MELVYPQYETRLLQLVQRVRGSDELNLTTEWKKDLDDHESEYWAERISAMTDEKVKVILNRLIPPSVSEIESLDEVDPKDYNPGVYFGFVGPRLRAFSKRFAYTGSGTRVGRGIGDRTSQHKNPDYRAAELKKRPDHYFYSLLENDERELTCFTLASMKWPGSSAADITTTRVLCVLAEQVYMIWLRTYTPRAAAASQKHFSAMCPFKDVHFPYSGINQASPVRNDIQKATKDGAPLTPEERNKRTTAMNRERLNNMNAEEKKGVLKRRADYHQRVAKRVRSFKRRAKTRGIPTSKVDAKVKAFQKSSRDALREGRAVPNHALYHTFN